MDKPICQAPTECATPGSHRLRKALSTLRGCDENDIDAKQTTHSLAHAFAASETISLRVYQAAACLREGQLREIVQFLIFSRPEASLTTTRLLVIMQGLAGNWELTMEFLGQRASESLKSLPTRVYSLIAMLGGRKAYGLLDWSPVIERAFQYNENEALWALSTVSEYLWEGPKESVLRVDGWEAEVPYENEASIWRELQWAAYARSVCVNIDFRNSPSAGPSIAFDQGKESSRSETNFTSLTSDFGAAAPHYIRIFGTLIRRRSVIMSSSDESPIASASQAENVTPPLDRSVVLTPTVCDTGRNMAAYLAYGVPFVLEGPTGCGKTALLSWLARQTLYEHQRSSQKHVAPGVTFIQMDNAMLVGEGESFSSLIGCVVPVPDGRGFRWRPGPIGVAAERGKWIIFENIGSSTGRMSSATAIISKLARSKPGDKLEAPGRGEPIVIGRGFRCVATRTSSEDEADDCWEPPGGWDSWCRVTMRDLSYDEKVGILSGKHEQARDCIPRVVSVVEEVAKYTKSQRGPLFRTPTLREAVKICERLEMTRQQSGSLSPEIAFLETMDVLVAWCPSHSHFMEMSNMVSLCWSLSPQIGADIYMKHRPDISDSSHSTKIGRTSFSKITASPRNEFSRLSLTGHTLRLLERTLRCLEMRENVLLSGETGSGKTAVVQELASLMGRKLVVVNLSRQSELDDLIGGFRPVESDTVIPLLAKRFEAAFCRCMSRQKNAPFLDALQTASRSARHHIRAFRLMQGAISAIPKPSRQDSSSLMREWGDIAASLEKLDISRNSDYSIISDHPETSHRDSNDSSPEPRKKRPRVSMRNPGSADLACSQDGHHSTRRKRSRRVEFEFSEGVLVQAMRSGDWILLDELNLAPPELLERLVSILDVGEVTLGNEHSEVVSMQNGFALLGAMNPPTDAGKRPLPSVLRTRFTEIHVGDMVDKDDIVDLVVRKFFSVSLLDKSPLPLSRLEADIASNVADFYLASFAMAREGHIEDTTGKPVRFSLRNLSRMLDFAAGLNEFLKSGTDGKRRALFEGALVALGTQLPRKPREELRRMAESFLLRNSTASRRKRERLVELMLDQHGFGVSLRILHGFPVEVKASASFDTLGSEGPQTFVVTPAVERTLTHVCRVMVIGAPRLPVLLQGPTAAGKTSLINYLAEKTGNNLTRINNHEHTEISEYIGGYVASSDGSLIFSEGPLVRAVRNGEWVMLDELNLAPPDVLESLNRLLDDNREIFIPETGEVIKAAKEFRLFATQNPPGLYGGRKELSRAFRSRFVEVQVDELPDTDLHTILERKASIPKSFARKMVTIMRDLQVQRRSSGLFSGREGYITARDLFRWASREPRSKEELAIHGFLLLAERARCFKERLLVKKVICKVVGVANELLSDESLYSFVLDEDDCSSSSQCLEFALKKLSIDRSDISQALFDRHIVLTPSMRRMLTLLIHCVANAEPALLVGATGGGKTSSCEAIAAGLVRQLLTVNCHRHTEASDVLGGFRPARHKSSTGPLFEWADGPLVTAMKTGSWMLLDEINMADDAVIERLNSVLELERTLVLSEKGTAESLGSPEVVVACKGFRIVATMNPGGDYGKKELSPALRNRFTELWIPPPASLDDYLPIVHQRLGSPESLTERRNLASHLILDVLTASVNKLGDSLGDVSSDVRVPRISVRDLTAWCDFIVEAPKVCDMDALLATVHGARLVFLDGLSVGLASFQDKDMERRTWQRILSFVPQGMRTTAERVKYSVGTEIMHSLRDPKGLPTDDIFKVDCFKLPRNSSNTENRESTSMSAFSFKAPNTLRNTARIARALCVGSRPVLLEGPPGSGKSSLVAALASVSGFKCSRINLSECTEMSDLAGGDAPGQERGSFVFRSGPLLDAMREGSWILLDELNLASQSVLEGLNSVLDHRKSIFVPELNTEFHAHPLFRIFGAQNSALEGGGRRGLPQSFLNRFNRVTMEAPDEADIEAIVSSIHPLLSQEVIRKVVKCLKDMRLSMKASNSSTARFGLRDALRWCDLLNSVPSQTLLQETEVLPHSQLCAYFDVAILQGLTRDERSLAEACYTRVFGYAFDFSRALPSMRVMGRKRFRIGYAAVERFDELLPQKDGNNSVSTLVASRSRELQAASFAINACWPIAFFSPSSCIARHEAIRLVQQLAVLYGKRVRLFNGASLTDTEDFVGGYVQQDLFASMRKILVCCEELMQKAFRLIMAQRRQSGHAIIRRLLEMDRIQAELRKIVDEAERHWQSASHCVPRFLHLLQNVLEATADLSLSEEVLESCLETLHRHHDELGRLQHAFGGSEYASFKWCKSDLMQAIEAGEWVYFEDADSCPPALLDRLNPIFERAAVSASDEGRAEHEMTFAPTILAEAPTCEDGSANCLQPHPQFRMFFSISKTTNDLGQCGISRPLLDRSLKICLEESTSTLDRDAVLAADGLSLGPTLSWSRTSDGRYERVGSLDSTSDVATLASRTRFARAILDDALGTKRFAFEERICNILPHSECAGASHVLEDIPFTKVGEYVENAALSFWERDLASIRFVENSQEQFVRNVIEKGRKVLESIMLPGSAESLQKRHGECEALIVMELKSSSANAFILGSISEQDLAERAVILKSLVTRLSPAKSHAIYLNEVDATLGYITSSAPSVGTWSQYVFPMDPLYGMDSWCAHILPPEADHEQACQYRSKRFRSEVLALCALRSSWKQAQRVSGPESLFARTKVYYSLQAGKSDGEPTEHLSLKSLAFDIVASAVKCIDPFCNMIRAGRGWETSHEEEWMRFFTLARDVCDFLSSTAHDQPVQSALAAILYDTSLTLQEIDDRRHSSFDSRLELLHCRLMSFQNSVGEFLTGSRQIAIPSSRFAQGLEDKILKACRGSRKANLSVSEIETVINGLATLPLAKCDREESILATLGKVVDLITSKPEYERTRTQSLDEWSRALSAASLQAARDAVVAIMTTKFVLGSRVSWQEETTSLIHNSVAVMTCVSEAQLSSVACLQKLAWIAESANKEPGNVAHRKFSGSHLKASAAVTLLSEINSFLVRMAPDDNWSIEGNDRFSTKSSRLMRTSRDFWDLSAVHGEAACTSALISRGVHRIEHTDAAARTFLLKCSELLSFSHENLPDESLQTRADGGAVAPLPNDSKDIILQTEKEDVLSPHEAVQNALSGADKVSSAEALLRFGTAWIHVGVANLSAEYTQTTRRSGIDPALFSLSLSSLAFKKLLLSASSSTVYEVFAHHRLGGDSNSHSIPIHRNLKAERRYTDFISRASPLHMYRPPEKIGYEMFESFVHKVDSTITKRISNSALFRNTKNDTWLERLTQTKAEAIHLLKSCDALSRSLKDEGEVGHFRDISTVLALGLQQVQYGLMLITKAVDIHARVSTLHVSSKKAFLADFPLFPRAACNQARPISDALQLSMKLSMDGSSVLAFANYLLGGETGSNDYSQEDVSSCLSQIVTEWKKRTLADELETEKRESLHVLREVGRKDMIPGGEIIERLDQDEETDFVKTFNPITTDEEEQLHGFVLPNSEPYADRSEMHRDESEEDKGRKIDAAGFWHLHKTLYCPTSPEEKLLPKFMHRLEDILCVSGHLLSPRCLCADDIAIVATVWETFSSQSDSRLSSTSYSSNDQATRDSHSFAVKPSYNFYTDANIPEIESASIVLRSLKDAISHVQESAFRETGSHPVLDEVDVAIERVAKVCKPHTPLSRVVLGLENVLRKADEWHRLFATSQTRLDDGVLAVAKVVAQWRRLEVQSWPLLLESRVQSCETEGSRWVFLLYDAVIHEGTQSVNKDPNCIKDVVASVDQFLRSSSRGEFTTRLDMVLSMSRHILAARKGNTEESEKLGWCLRGLGGYYRLFLNRVGREMSHSKKVVDKELEEFTRLTAWGVSSGLGSSVKMGKEKDKYLQYYRLKTAAEKTRRKLHKLCLKVDAIVRAPVHESLSSEVSEIGFADAIEHADFIKDNVTCESRWSARIKESCRIIVDHLIPHTTEVPGIPKDMAPSLGEDLLSRIKDFAAKLSALGKKVANSDDIACDLATKFSVETRSAIRARIMQLRDSNITDIQFKKRALVELFKVLQRSGISPFESSTKGDSHEWLSSPDPSPYEEYNQVANELFWKSAQHIQRLREVSDSRWRNADISNDEASKVRALSQRLFDLGLFQRGAMRNVFDEARKFSSEINALSRLNRNTETILRLKRVKIRPQELSFCLQRLKKVLIDLEACQKMFAKLVQDVHRTKTTFEHSRLQANFLLEIHAKQSDGVLRDLESILSTSVAAIKETVSSEGLTQLKSGVERTFGLLDVELAEAFLAANESVTKLCVVLNEKHAKATDISSDNFVGLVLGPVVSFLRAEFSSKTADVPAFTKLCEGEFVQIRSDVNRDANAAVEAVLLSTQRIMVWHDMRLTNGSFESKNADAKDEENPLFEQVEFRGMMKTANVKVLSLSSVLNIRGLLQILERNAKSIERLSQTNLDIEGIEEVLQLQQNLAWFLERYCSVMVVPCLQKCSLFHAHSLSLLRSVSSLFVGLCVEGFCRPPARSDEVGESSEIDGRQGGGFGDAGDGDLSNAQNVSDQIEDEEQLLGLRSDSQNNQDHRDAEDEKDQDGVEMSADFDGDLQVKNCDEEDVNGDEDSLTEEKEMAEESGFGDDVIDHRIWGDMDERQPENNDKEKDGDNSTRPKVNDGMSELVAKDEANPGKTEQTKDPGSEINQDNQTSDEIGESAKDVEKQSKERDPEEGKEENTEMPPNAKDVGQFDVDMEKTYSDDEREGAENAEEEDGRPHSQERQPKANEVDDFNRDESVPKDKDHENDGAERTSIEEEEDQTPEAEDFESEACDIENVGRDAMLGVENQIDADETGDHPNDDGIDIASIPEEMSLADDDETGVSQQGEEERSPPEILEETGQEHEDRADSEIGGDDCKAAKSDVDTMQPDVGNTYQGVSSLSTYDNADLPQPTGADGHDGKAVGLDTKDSTTKEPTIGGEERGSDEDPVHDQSTGTNQTGGDANLHGLHAATEQLREGELRENAPSTERDRENRHSSSLNPNPLRVSRPEELIKAWERRLLVLENEQETVAEQSSSQNPGGNEGLWQYQDAVDGGENDLHALGASTEDQQHPLEAPGPEDDAECALDKDLSKDDQGAKGEAAPLGKPANETEEMRRDQEDGKDEVNSDSAILFREDGQPFEKKHPAHKAAENASAKITSPTLYPEKDEILTREERLHDIMEVVDEEEAERPNLSKKTNDEVLAWKMETLGDERAIELWQCVDRKVSSGASTLCEQLRLILEPTTASGLSGGYRTGKRLNMRKVIEYVASDFQKDRIWLRRVKPDKRSYDVLVAIDDSASMAESEAGTMAIESLALVMSALAKLEIGRVGVARFGAEAEMVREFEEGLYLSSEAGGELLRRFSFSQKHTDVVKLLSFIQAKMGTNVSNGDGEHVSLVFVISDGRLSDREEVRRQLRHLKNSNVLVAFVILDQVLPDQPSIYEVKRVEYDKDGKLVISPYMEAFPLDFYTTVQDVRSLPFVLGDALRQWIEAANI